MPYAAMADAPSQPAGGEDVTALMGQIRDLAGQVDDLGGQYPSLAQEAQQIRALLRQMIIKAAQQAPTATPSGQAVPIASQ